MQWSNFREKRFWLSSLLFMLILALPFPSIAQEGENLCRTQITQTIEYGETMAGLVDSQIPYAFFCFDGERGDNVTVIVEVTDGRLIPVIIITDPVFSEEDLQNPLGQGVANREGGTAEAEFALDSSDTYLIVVIGDQNTLGTFEITVEAEASSIFGSSTETPDDNQEATETPDDENGNPDPSEIEIIPGETNFCRIEGTEYLEYGASVTGELDGASLPAAWYCFEGQAGDIVTLEVGTESGDLVMLAVIAQPFFDLSPNTVFGGDEASSRNDSAEVEFELPEDGDYLIFVQMSAGDSGEFYLELTGQAGVTLDCSVEPLSLLTNQQWMIAPAEGEAEVVAINLACDGQLAISVMGAPEVGFYTLDETGNPSFVFGNKIFTTVALDASTWTIANADGTEFNLVPVPDTTCSDETIAALINATWQLGDTSDAPLLSFTCNGIVLLNVQGQIAAQAYSFEEGTILIDLGQDTSIEFEDVVIEGATLTATVDGEALELNNILAD